MQQFYWVQARKHTHKQHKKALIRKKKKRREEEMHTAHWNSKTHTNQLDIVYLQQYAPGFIFLFSPLKSSYEPVAQQQG